jgi:pimeloyl-ACP methyl ester carboxylesterase
MPIRLAFTRSGAGPSLVLLHALGSSRQAWDPVVAALAEQFDVIAVDLPGFGESPSLPPEVEPLPVALAASVAALLDDLDVRVPHVAGNSLGGWVALELAHLRPLASLTLLSPAGLWRRNTPLYCRVTLRLTRWLAQRAAAPLSRVVAWRLGRIVVLGQTHGRPTRITPAQAREAIRSVGECPGFDAAFQATLHRRYVAGPPFDAPVTVAFGSRDVLLLPFRARRLDELPRDTHVGRLPKCGHIPLMDDPAAVAGLIVSATTRSRTVRSAV